MQALEHLKFINDHLFISMEVLFEDDLDSNLFTGRYVSRTLDNAKRASAKRFTKLVLGFELVGLRLARHTI